MILDVLAFLAVLTIMAVERARRQQHTCRWGDDPSGPYVSDEYIKSL